MIGSSLGHYRIVGKLGEGGMGIVYLALDEKLHRKVALKMLPPGLGTDPHRLARFEREVKSVAALNHPNIVTIYSVEEVDGKRFFTMEHIEGRTLAQMIPLDGLALPDFVKIAVPLAEALTAAHARGIQHRDLKPSNVMVTADGRVKVLDFGLARLKEHDRTEAFAFQPETTLTQAGLALGTLAYMSPEQLRMQATDHRSDIFSLGVVLFEMASGRCPFLGQSTAEVISSILRDQPARVYEENENVPEELDAILRRCLEKDPAKRWQSADELRESLSQVAAEVAYSTSAMRRSRAATSGAAGAAATAARRRTKTLVGGAVAMAALALIALAVWKWTGGRRGAGDAALGLASRGDVPSIAVLPLTSFSGEPEYFVDGITDALISSLARIRGLRVISRQSAMHYKDSKKLLPQIAKELGVNYIVEGSVARSGEIVRLRTQVLRADPETTLWSETFERPAAEILALESSFATALAEAINVRLSSAEQKHLSSQRAVDPAAYEAFLQGRYWAGKHGAEEFRRAQGYFERAIALDAAFAPAWVGLAEIHQRQGYFFDDLHQRLAQAETAVTRALALDSASAGAHAVRGDLHLARWEWASAETSIRRAIEIEPSSAAPHLNYWRLLMRLRRFDEARPEIELARELDPLSANITANYGYQISIEGDCEKALTIFDETLAIDPDFTLVHAYAWYCHHEQGRDPQRGLELVAWLRTERLPELADELPVRLTRDGYDAALSWVANELDRRSDDPRINTGLAAGLLACAGEEDKAMRWLQRGFDRRDWVMGWIATTNDLRNLHDRDDYRELVRKIGLEAPDS